ncbi:hypothetical protein ASG25_11530 [Rhizobium sp. Leaf384]|jgi:hypothetical protein|uniref:hypothetical protein n=1 Tax=unclassified Rhizobium TaxID=2613769 RepID=UPI0007133A23|nr:MULTISPECIES: hypothetical protein [unclassified Rhizobium]KQR68782.1 hypothetical protein ASG03_05845 [Rhizobium sp. Leaf341]KQS79193.1 hypothetical protein ASG25_11530 [Rhizobium sp. Leaf384]KQS82761.1 hypothetical protein ASG58_05345 [Rhizobium sp. Leaf383]
MTNLDLPEGHREHESTATKAANLVRSEATAVRQTAAEHPSSTLLLLGLVGLAGFLIGHGVGYRKAESDHIPTFRRFWS